MSIVAALSELSGKRKQIEEAAREQAKAILAPGLKEFMSQHPEVKVICWTQYTPYFNDGDACTFSVNTVAVSLTEDAEDGPYGDDWHELHGKSKEGFSDATWKDLVELGKALEGSSDELEAAFGDHVRVLVTHAGVDVEEYEHD